MPFLVLAAVVLVLAAVVRGPLICKPERICQLISVLICQFTVRYM
jgi:hypothetical protein